MPETEPYSIAVTPAGDRVVVEFSGHVTGPMVRAYQLQLDALETRIKPRFTLLVDMTRLEKMEPDCLPELGRVMDRFNAWGAEWIVRVIPDVKKDIGLGILSLFHYRRGIRTNTVPTRAEADHLIGA